jgi:HEAT repeat protein
MTWMVRSGFMSRIVLVGIALGCSAGALAAQETGVLGKPVVTWMRGLDSNDPLVRRGAAFALGKSGPDGAFAVKKLVALFGDRDPDVRDAAAFAVGEIAPDDAQEAFNGLLRLLIHDKEGRVRRSAAYAIGRLGPRAAKAASKHLLDRLANDSDPGVRQNAAWALGRLGPNPELVPNLAAALDDRDALVRRDAADALREYGQSAGLAAQLLLKLAVSDDDEPVREAARSALVAVVGPKNQSLVAPLGKMLKDSNPEVVRSAAMALGNIGGPEAAIAVPILVEALKSEDVDARQMACAALANFKEHAEPAIPQLRDALKDADPIVRRNAALALGSTGVKAADTVRDLARLLHSREPDDVRFQAIQAIAFLGPAAERALPEILAVLASDPNPRARHRAVWCVRVVEDWEKTGITKALVAVLHEKQPETLGVRYEAARYLALKLRSDCPDEAVEILYQMLLDRNVKLYGGSGASVSGGTEGTGGTTKVSDNFGEDGRFLPAQALGAVGRRLAGRPDIVKALRDAAADKDSARLREEAAQALRSIGVD